MLEYLETIKEEAQAHVQHGLELFDEFAYDFRPWQVAVLAVVAYLSIVFLWEELYMLWLNEPNAIHRRFLRSVFSYVRKIPMVRNRIKSELGGIIKHLGSSILKEAPGKSACVTLPEKPLSASAIMAQIDALGTLSDLSSRMRDFKVSGAIYAGGPGFEEYTQLLTKIYGLYMWSNPLHFDMFPDVRQMEAEIVAMTISAFNGGAQVCGNTTSGGTESILMACKAYREWGASRGISKPNMVIPRTAHPAFLKGCQYFGITVRLVTEDQTTFETSASKMAKYIDSNTVALVASCPNFPFGSIDPVEDIARVARSKGVGLHVDCCLGSFIVAFMKKAGFHMKPFDFSVKGVTSISCDTHKYGYAPKGSSVIMYSTPELRHFSYSTFPNWPGGVYATPTIAGSRPGGCIAVTWAAFMYHGETGYISNCKKIVDVTRTLASGITAIKGLRLVCEPASSVVSWTSDVFDINAWASKMIDELHWSINVLQFPASVHLCLTMVHTADGFLEKFLGDCKTVAEDLIANPPAKTSGSGAMYGMSQKIPDRSIIQDMCCAYLDTAMRVAGAPERT